ncbi:MAG: acylphosphatase [ANME-2 cluster archaeon]|nr:acylphosphatase [ANME-2 cluster archaeon]
MTIGRVHLIISGKVQGVYFRYHTMEKAVELGLYGWVKNRIDGEVEAVFEGAPIQVNEMVQWCRTGPPHANVTDVQEVWEEPTGEFGSFRIKYD